MPTSSTLLVFILASYALAVVPGPAVVYIVNRSLGQGRVAGVYSALGIATGGLVHVVAAAIGVSAILTASAPAFTIVRYAGAAYLVFLGMKALRSGDLQLEAGPATVSTRRLFSQGVIVNILNPKTALFFLSFFPQFIHSEDGAVVTQMIVLGLVFIVCALSSDLVYAIGAGSIRQVLTARGGARAAHRYMTAIVFFALGAAAALTE